MNNNLKPYRCPNTNVPIYPSLPEGMKVATASDLWTTSGLPHNRTVLVKSFHTGLYQAYTINMFMENHWVIPFLEENHVFIKK